MQRARALHTMLGVHPAVGLALMLAGAIAVGRGITLERRRRRLALASIVRIPLAPQGPLPEPPRISPMATPLHTRWDDSTVPQDQWRRPSIPLPIISPTQPVEVYMKHQ